MHVHGRILIAILSGIGAVAASPADTRGKVIEVSMKNSPKGMFMPNSIRIREGDTVKWTNTGVISHSVTFDPAHATKPSDVVLPGGVAPFDSGTMEEDATFTHTFTVKGTYKYVCKFHEGMGMIGTVVVS